MVKEPLQRAILAAEGVDKTKNAIGSLVFLHREKNSRAIGIGTLLKDGSVFEQTDKAEACEHLNEPSLDDIKAQLSKAGGSFERIHFVVSPHEVIIEIPDEGMAVRYFDPAKANVITPYSDITRLSTKVIGPRLNRQIIHRVKMLPNSMPENFDDTNDRLFEDQYATGMVMGPDGEPMPWNRPQVTMLNDVNDIIGARDVSALTLLDLGCGDGAGGSLELAKMKWQRGVYVDASKSATTIFQQKISGIVTNTDIRTADMLEALSSFESNSFDVIHAHMSLHYFTLEKTESILREIKRVLKPGGTLLFKVFSTEETDLEQEAWEKIEGEGEYYRGRDGKYKRLFTKDNLEELLKKTGFSEYKLHQITIEGWHNKPWVVKTTKTSPIKTCAKVNNYVDKNKILFKDMLDEGKPDTLLRVPVEAIETLGIDDIKNFLATFQEAPNGYVELYYMSGTGEVSDNMYQKYGLQKKSLPKDFKRARENTVTLFPALKGEDITQAVIRSRLGNLNITSKDTILSPVGLQHDPAGLIRAAILGLKIMDVARQIKENKTIDKDAMLEEGGMLNQLRSVIDSKDFEKFNVTPDDIIALAAGDINHILTALNKLIKLLPIAPINAEELRQIYEHVKAVITAA